MSNLDPYADIRPFNDSEVADVLLRMTRNQELISAISQYRFPMLHRWLPGVCRALTSMGVARQFDDVQTVRQFQDHIAGYMGKMIQRTTTKLSCSGIERLDPDEAYLFVSNHRDIAMDPAFVNWMLYQKGFDTLRIAIGDNLLSKDYVSDLMRLNKSFIVKRSAKAPREMMAALTQLSSYLDHSIQQGQSVWIAQREGRAKDGDDRTDPALLKMFYMSQRKQRSFAEAAQRLNIVPVSISYEYDPCDAAKARELHAKSTSGEYAKSEHEDIASIVKGITDFKGAVHVHFGEQIEGEFETPEALAEEIDRQIHQGYRLHPSNLIAAGQLEEVDQQQQKFFSERFADLTEAEREIVHRMYATPYFNQQAEEAS